MKIVKRVLLGLAFIMILGVIVIVSAIAIMEYKTYKINDNYSSVFTDEKYAEAVSVKDIPVITQSVSCGYATIEMFSSWNGSDITETALFDEYGKVVTSTGKSFSEEMNRRFPEYKHYYV